MTSSKPSFKFQNHYLKNKRCRFLGPKLIKLQARTSFRSVVFLSSPWASQQRERIKPTGFCWGFLCGVGEARLGFTVSPQGCYEASLTAYPWSSPNPQIKKNSFVNRWLGVLGVFHGYVRKILPIYLAFVRLRNSEAKIWISTLESWEGVPVHWDSIYSKPLVSIPYEPTGTMECNEKSYIEPCSEQALWGERRTYFLRKKTFVFVGRLGSR